MQVLGGSVLVAAGEERIVCSPAANGRACVAQTNEHGFHAVDPDPTYRITLCSDTSVLERVKGLSVYMDWETICSMSIAR
jgi:hypothetical protein